MNLQRNSLFVVSLLIVASGAAACTRGAATVQSDASPLPDVPTSIDAAPPDAVAPSFDCDPIETGIYVVGNRVDASLNLLSRPLSSYDPLTNTLTDLANLQTCIEGYYVRAMTVSRSGVAYLLLANQTIARYTIATDTCDVHVLERTLDDGLYELATFVGNGAASRAAYAERLLLGFRSASDPAADTFIEFDTDTNEETLLFEIETGDTQLVSFVGTDDGSLFGVRASPERHTIVQIEPTLRTASVVATLPSRPGVWFRTAIAFWDGRMFVFDAFQDSMPRSTVSEINLGAATWSAAVLTAEQFEVQAVSTTTCVGVLVF